MIHSSKLQFCHIFIIVFSFRFSFIFYHEIDLKNIWASEICLIMAFAITVLSLHAPNFCPGEEYWIGTEPAATVVPHPSFSLCLTVYLFQTTSLL